MSARNLHRLSGTVARLAAEALAGPCRIGDCGEPSVGYIQGISGRPVGVCGRHVEGAEARGYVVHREAPTERDLADWTPDGARCADHAADDLEALLQTETMLKEDA